MQSTHHTEMKNGENDYTSLNRFSAKCRGNPGFRRIPVLSLAVAPAPPLGAAPIALVLSLAVAPVSRRFTRFDALMGNQSSRISNERGAIFDDCHDWDVTHFAGFFRSSLARQRHSFRCRATLISRAKAVALGIVLSTCCWCDVVRRYVTARNVTM